MRKNKTSFLLSSVVILATLTACGKVKKTDAEIEREKWVAGFKDSIEYYQDRVNRVETQLQALNTTVADNIENFELIKNPREVEGYYLLKGWQSKIPLKSTGIYARINQNEKLELIATLAGATFNEIGVGTDTDEFYSEVVPYDQAFNFRHERFNTVYFSGGKADTIAQFIAQHQNDKISLDFLEGKVKKKFQLPENEKEMIAKTWNLYFSQKESKKLQKELWISSQKIATFQRLTEENNNIQKN